MKGSRRLGPVSLLAAALLLSSCNPLLQPSSESLEGGSVIQHVPYTGSFSYTVDGGSPPQDVYFVFTNTSLTQNAAQKPSVSGTVITVDNATIPSPQPQPMYAVQSAPTTLAERIAEFNRDAGRKLETGAATARGSSGFGPPGAPSYDTVGVGGTLKDFGAGDVIVSVPATCQYVSPLITVAGGGTRKLNIWVANDCWTGGTKRHLVNSTMVAALADKFLKTGLGNDIYDYDRSVIGAEWGPQSFSNLIPANGEITILLSDIEADNSDTGGVVGYFWSGNNFLASSVPDSNQRIMFVLDAVMYANPSPTGATGTGTAGWDPVTSYWPRFVFSTLAHEFQHMIQFYQKQVLQRVQTGTDTWINEMCSMIMEDLVADKLSVEGPRGVNPADGSAGSPGNTLGRFPGFNRYCYYPLAQTGSYGIIDYSVSYAFGSWLARNYGGATLLKRIVQSAATNESAVTGAAAAYTGRGQESMARLLEKWSASVLLSDTMQAPAGYRYNTGGWTTSTEGGLPFNLGSINVFNYSPSLYVYTGSGTVPPSIFYRSSNTYFQAATKLASSRTWKITIPQNVLMSVVIK
jgi:hypothetical protein